MLSISTALLNHSTLEPLSTIHHLPFTIYALRLTRMPKPEIARRCPSCGASIRVRAFFCPQCGKTLNGQKAHSKNASPDAKTEMLPGNNVPLTETHPDTPPEDKAQQTSSVAEAADATVLDQAPPIESFDVSSKEGAAQTGSSDATVKGGASRTASTARLKSNKAVARHAVRDDVLHRVENLRQISSVVIDEASYDPSLRFVLVAAFLFIVFLVILVLSELIT
jgi:predicted RNA-binding Zn-ribbon protein involved in translation (DUF1610 family)